MFSLRSLKLDEGPDAYQEYKTITIMADYGQPFLLEKMKEKCSPSFNNTF